MLYAQGIRKVDVTPSIVYSNLLQLHKEVKLLKKYFHISKNPVYKDMKTKMYPRHARQRSYELFVKINILREKSGFPMIEPANMEPTLVNNPVFTYEQVQRLLREVDILKFLLGIKENVSKLKTIKGKTPTDVYNLINLISREFDLINGVEFTPSYVFSEAIRIYEDLEAVLDKLNIDDTTVPPAKIIISSPKDSYTTTMEFLGIIKALETQVGLPTIDYYAFERKNVTSSDVYEIIQIALSEIQVVKAYIGLRHNVTRGALRFEGKTPADVKQIMEWLLRKVKLINSLSYIRGKNNEV